MIGTWGSCRRLRPALLELVERGERGPATPEALEHLAICRACEREVVGVALTVAALRRAGSAYRRLPEPPPAPLAVAAGPARGSRLAWRLQLGGLVTGAALAALVVLPRAGLPTAVTPAVAPDSITPAHAPGVNPWQVAERRLASSPDTGPVVLVEAPAGSVPPRYPDTMFRPLKEVTASDASARVLEPR